MPSRRARIRIGTTLRSSRSRPLALALVFAGLALAVPLARAVDQTVTATPSNDFVDANVTVDIGDTVTWTNAGGLHNVKFDDGSFEQPAGPQGNAWSVSRTFDSAGTFRYYCEAHGDVNGAGMSGTVTVNPASTEPPPVPVPSPVPPPGTGTTPAPAPPAAPAEPVAPDTTAAVISRFSMSRTRFHVGRGRTAGSAFRFRLSEPATVRIALERLVTGRRVGRRCRKPSASNRRAPRCIRRLAVATLVRTDRKAGDNTVAFSGRIGRLTLRPGRYRATISATDAAGNRSRTKDRVFRVLPA